MNTRNIGTTTSFIQGTITWQWLRLQLKHPAFHWIKHRASTKFWETNKAWGNLIRFTKKGLITSIQILLLSFEFWFSTNVTFGRTYSNGLADWIMTINTVFTFVLNCWLHLLWHLHVVMHSTSAPGSPRTVTWSESFPSWSEYAQTTMLVSERSLQFGVSALVVFIKIQSKAQTLETYIRLLR